MVTDRRRIYAWAFYDWANSAFATTVMAGFFPIFFKQYWASSLTATESTYHLGVANTVSSLIIALLSPLLGALADRGSLKKRLLFFFTVLGAITTLALYFVAHGAWGYAIWLYVLGSIGFAGGNIFYDALLIEVAPAEQRHRVSTLGYALGYLGGGLLFGLNVVMTLKPALFGLPDAATAVRIAFVTVGIWWGAFAIPLFFWVKEQRPSAPVLLWRAVVASLVGWLPVYRDIVRLRPVALFLLAYYFYIDGVHTVMRMAVDYGMALGFPSNSLIIALLVTQFVGLPATLLFGRAAHRFGARSCIYVGIAVYMVITFWAAFMHQVYEFYALAIAVGCVQGGVQALSRSYFAGLVPPEKAGEFFGFFNMLGKFASVIGPILMGVTAELTGSSRWSIASVLLLFTVGFVILLFCRPEQRHNN